jgi:hypothetical protein
MRPFTVVDAKQQVTAKSFETFGAADRAMQMLGGEGLSILDDAGSHFVWNDERGQFDMTAGAAALSELLVVSPLDVDKVRVAADEDVFGRLVSGRWVYIGSYREMMAFPDLEIDKRVKEEALRKLLMSEVTVAGRVPATSH